MKTKAFLFNLSFCILLIGSCNNTPTSSSKSDKLYIKITTVTDPGENMKKTYVVNVESSDYFEVSMDAQTDGGYLAQKWLSQSEDELKLLTIVKKDSSDVKFNTSTDFLNFMSAHGYEMVDQVKNEYGGDYTFKKK